MKLNNDQSISIHGTKGGKSKLYVKYEQTSIYRNQFSKHYKKFQKATNS